MTFKVWGQPWCPTAETPAEFDTQFDERADAEEAEWAEHQKTFGDDADQEIAKALRERGDSLLHVAFFFSFMYRRIVRPSQIAMWELKAVAKP